MLAPLSLQSLPTHLLPVFQGGLKEPVGDFLPPLPPEPVVHGVQEVLD